MCCFSRAVPFVGGTKIFVRDDVEGRQLLAYSMDVEIDEPLAMVLPLPVPEAGPEDAVRFIDLSGYPGFFKDLAAAFPPAMMPAQRSRSFGSAAHGVAGLVVHDVGDFEASFVPRVRDFARLDERFRLPPALFEALPVYGDYGFAVFRLKPKVGMLGKARRQTVHPMAFSFPRRDGRSLFFPTVHVHDGSVPASASFDHALYCQPGPVVEALLGWTRSTTPLGAHVAEGRARGLVRAAEHGMMTARFGPMSNVDTWLREPDGVTLADLTGRGDSWSFRVAATSAFAPPSTDARTQAWRRTAEERLPALCRGLREGLVAFAARSGVTLRLAPLEDTLPPYFMNGRQLWSGTSYMDGRRHAGGGRGCVRFTPFTSRVEPQEVRLAFDEVPDAARTEEILGALEDVVDRAAGYEGTRA